MAIPAFYSSDDSEEEWSNQINRMFRSSQLTRWFVDGKITPQDYEDGIADLGINPYEIEEVWDSGESLLL